MLPKFQYCIFDELWRVLSILSPDKTIQMTTQDTTGKLSFAYAFMNTADKTWAGGFARQGNRNSRVKTNSECAWTSSPCFVSTRQVKITSFIFFILHLSQSNLTKFSSDYAPEYLGRPDKFDIWFFVNDVIDFNNFAGFLKVVGFKRKNDLRKARFFSTLLLPRLPETKMNRARVFDIRVLF